MLIKNITYETKEQIFRYIAISTSGYAFVFLGLYIFVELLDINHKLSFVIIYGVCYLTLYFVQLLFLFKVKHNSRKIFKFFLYLLANYIIANGLFNIFCLFNIHYLLATAFTIAMLMPLRFIISKYFVFSDY
jgi:putative flippase GtrA